MATPSNLADIAALYGRVKARDAARQSKMTDVLAVREGRMKDVYRELFPDGPYQDGVVANMIDVAARDLAEVMSPLPAFNCASGHMTSDSARKFAEKRTQIVNGYVTHSRLGRQMFDASDRYLTYGFALGMVEIDEKAKLPRIVFHDSLGTYVVRDRWGDPEAVFMCTRWDRDDLVAAYPEVAGHLGNHGLMGSQSIEVVRYHSDKVDMLFQPAGHGFTLLRAENPMGKCLARVAMRPGVTSRGQFDDVLAVQVAKARFALLGLEAATKAVQAPLAVPNDITEMAFGPDSIIQTQFPEKVGRVRLDVPPSMYAQQAEMDRELQQGSRYTNARNGEVEGSIVTGKGVEALMSGFDTQIRTGQAVFALMLTDLIELCLEVDETLWGDVERTVRGNTDGTPYEVTYRPNRDIRGDYTVDVQYGLMAGLGANQALVFGLQALGASLLSKDFVRRQLPFALNATEEEATIDVEHLRDGLMQAVMAYGQALPIMAQNGMDVSQVLQRIAMIVEGRTKGKAVEKLVSEAFAPEPQTPPGVEPSGADAAPVPGSPDSAPPGGSPDGMQPSGLVDGVAPGQAGMGPGGRPDVANLLAGITGRGTPTLAANVQRRLPI